MGDHLHFWLASEIRLGSRLVRPNPVAWCSHARSVSMELNCGIPSWCWKVPWRCEGTAPSHIYLHWNWVPRPLLCANNFSHFLSLTHKLPLYIVSRCCHIWSLVLVHTWRLVLWFVVSAGTRSWRLLLYAVYCELCLGAFLSWVESEFFQREAVFCSCQVTRRLCSLGNHFTLLASGFWTTWFYCECSCSTAWSLAFSHKFSEEILSLFLVRHQGSNKAFFPLTVSWRNLVILA